jgi:drug/metabolite transporter (DMT)-like permease
VIYAPFYFGIRGLHLAQVAVADLAIQVIFQGIVVTIISLVLYCRAVLILGASRGSAFGALVPALSAVLAIPLTGERPTASGWVGIVLISAGVYLASGGPLPAMRHASSTMASTHNDRHSESFRFPSF